MKSSEISIFILLSAELSADVDSQAHNNVRPHWSLVRMVKTFILNKRTFRTRINSMSEIVYCYRSPQKRTEDGQDVVRLSHTMGKFERTRNSLFFMITSCWGRLGGKFIRILSHSLNSTFLTSSTFSAWRRFDKSERGSSQCLM